MNLKTTYYDISGEGRKFIKPKVVNETKPSIPAFASGLAFQGQRRKELASFWGVSGTILDYKSCRNERKKKRMYRSLWGFPKETCTISIFIAVLSRNPFFHAIVNRKNKWLFALERSPNTIKKLHNYKQRRTHLNILQQRSFHTPTYQHISVLQSFVEDLQIMIRQFLQHSLPEHARAFWTINKEGEMRASFITKPSSHPDQR